MYLTYCTHVVLHMRSGIVNSVTGEITGSCNVSAAKEVSTGLVNGWWHQLQAWQKLSSWARITWQFLGH